MIDVEFQFADGRRLLGMVPVLPRIGEQVVFDNRPLNGQEPMFDDKPEDIFVHQAVNVRHCYVIKKGKTDSRIVICLSGAI